MKATDIKELIDFESIKGILYLCYAHQDDKVDRNYIFNGTAYGIRKDAQSGDISFKRSDGANLHIHYSTQSLEDNPITTHVFYGITCTIEVPTYDQPTIYIGSEGFVDCEDISKYFDVILRGSWDDIYYQLNETDGSNIPVVSNNGGSLIFDDDGVKYNDYYLLNNGRLLYKGEEVPTKDELESMPFSSNPVVNHYVRERIAFYDKEYQDFRKIIEFRKRILGTNIAKGIFSKGEMSEFYIELEKTFSSEYSQNTGSTGRKRP